MKRCFSAFLLAAALLAAPFLRADQPPLHFLRPDAIDLKAVLPAPPATGSLAALADLETVLRVQAARTPNDIAWARANEHDSAFLNASVLGAWFTKENLPVTAAFLKEVSDDMFNLSGPAKTLYPRPRPPLVDPAVKPCVELPNSGSYPSGHSLRAYFWAAVLGDIFPEQQAALLERARLAAWGRVIGGVHFPSDTIGGRLLGEAIVEALRKAPTYRAGVEKCRAEVAPYLLKKAA